MGSDRMCLMTWMCNGVQMCAFDTIFSSLADMMIGPFFEQPFSTYA